MRPLAAATRGEARIGRSDRVGSAVGQEGEGQGVRACFILLLCVIVA